MPGLPLPRSAVSPGGCLAFVCKRGCSRRRRDPRLADPFADQPGAAPAFPHSRALTGRRTPPLVTRRGRGLCSSCSPLCQLRRGCYTANGRPCLTPPLSRAGPAVRRAGARILRVRVKGSAGGAAIAADTAPLEPTVKAGRRWSRPQLEDAPAWQKLARSPNPFPHPPVLLLEQGRRGAG